MSRKASLNGIRHGVLSTKLILDGENIDDYQALLGDLLRELKSVGTLACSLVEKIAITLWRQRRLVNAESAAVDLSLNPRRIVEEVETGMGLSEFEAGTISPDDLRPWNQEQTDQLKWCKDVIAEYQSSDSFDLDSLAKKAPLISEQLQLTEDAKADKVSIQKYLATSNLEEYIQELVSWCHKEAAKLEKHQARYPAMVAAAEMAEDKLRIPGQNLDVLTQYQTTLDNQLYKTLKNLREAPEWRIRAIDAGSEPVNQDVSVDAA